MDKTNNTVILPCGDVGTAGPTICGERAVYHHDRRFGCGPWICPVASLTPADQATETAYQARCDAR